MKLFAIIVFLSATFSFISCKKKQAEVAKIDMMPDTLYKLLDNSLALDSIEFGNASPFLYIKTGNFLSATTKNALLFSCGTDSTFKIELYSKVGNKWLKDDEVNELESCYTHFFLDFQDYNFDSQTDIYLPCSISNGYSLSRGHLITINSQTKALETHPEARDLANLNPNFKTKIVTSEEIHDCNTMPKICYTLHKWINGKLRRVKKECPCSKM